jgi:hypothetical protein
LIPDERAGLPGEESAARKPVPCPVVSDYHRLFVGNTHGSCCVTGVLAGHGLVAGGLQIHRVSFEGSNPSPAPRVPERASDAKIPLRQRFFGYPVGSRVTL